MGKSENGVGIWKVNGNGYNKTRVFKYYVANHMYCADTTVEWLHL